MKNLPRYLLFFFLLTSFGVCGQVYSVKGIKKPSPAVATWGVPDPVGDGMTPVSGNTVNVVYLDDLTCTFHGASCEKSIQPTKESAAAGCEGSEWTTESTVEATLGTTAAECDYRIYYRAPTGRKGVTQGGQTITVKNDIYPPTVPEWKLEPQSFVTGDVLLAIHRSFDPAPSSYPLLYRFVCESGSCSTTSWVSYENLPVNVSVGGAGTHCYTAEVKDALGKTSASEEKCVTTS